jgi:hypothetical protein
VHLRSQKGVDHTNCSCLSTPGLVPAGFLAVAAADTVAEMGRGTQGQKRGTR